MLIDLAQLKEYVNTNGKLVLRPSGLQQFINCPIQWFQASLLHNYQRPAAAAEAGSSLHKGAEVGYTEKIKTGKLPPLSVVTDATVEEWKLRNENGDIEFKDGQDYSKIETELVQDITNYHSEVMQECNPLAVETRYSFDIDHPIFSAISGTIDIDLEGGLADIKRTSKSIGNNTAKYILQQSIYAWLKGENGKLCVSGEIHNVVANKDSKVVPLNFNINYAKFIVNQILDVTRDFWETGNVNLFRGSSPVSNYLCSPNWCGYWNSCHYVKELNNAR